MHLQGDAPADGHIVAALNAMLCQHRGDIQRDNSPSASACDNFALASLPCFEETGPSAATIVSGTLSLRWQPLYQGTF